MYWTILLKITEHISVRNTLMYKKPLLLFSYEKTLRSTYIPDTPGAKGLISKCLSIHVNNGREKTLLPFLIWYNSLKLLYYFWYRIQNRARRNTLNLFYSTHSIKAENTLPFKGSFERHDFLIDKNIFHVSYTYFLTFLRSKFKEEWNGKRYNVPTTCE